MSIKRSHAPVATQQAMQATNLYTATREYHHACEEHPIGQKMAIGAITRVEWAYWLHALQVLHWGADGLLPDHMRRDLMFRADLSVLPRVPKSPAAQALLDDLGTVNSRMGLAYVLHGAHVSGGRVLAPKMAKRGLPTGHVCYRHPDQVRGWVSEMRGRGELAPAAKAAFCCLLGVMDEISRGNLAEDEGAHHG